MRTVDLAYLFQELHPWISAFAVSPSELPGVLLRIVNYTIGTTLLIAIIMALRRLPQIRETIKDFINARGPIWDLRNMVNDLKALEPIINDLRLLEPQIKVMAERFERLSQTVEVIREQNIDAQIESTAERTDNGVEEASADQAPTAARQRVVDDENWSRLRRLFLRNARRVQARVENIADGRTRGAYDRIGWKRPKVIIERLRDDGLISRSAARASLDLVDRFNAFRPRRSAVPDEVVGAMEVLDRQLEQELGPAPPDDELE